VNFIVWITQQQPPPAGITTQQFYLAVFGLVLGSGVVAALATGFLNRHKLKGDTAKVIQEAAAGVVKDLREDNQELRLRVDKMEVERAEDKQIISRMVADHDADRRKWETEKRQIRDFLVKHSRWDEELLEYVRHPDAFPDFVVSDPPHLVPDSW
jgi:hypothetical protein